MKKSDAGSSVVSCNRLKELAQEWSLNVLAEGIEPMVTFESYLIDPTVPIVEPSRAHAGRAAWKIKPCTISATLANRYRLLKWRWPDPVSADEQ
jgi:hypothetical protein